MGKVSPERIISALKEHGQLVYDQHGNGWWLPWREFADPNAQPPEEWIPPIRIQSHTFTQFIAHLVHGVAIAGKAAKDIQEACTAEAFKGNCVTALEWSTYDHAYRALRIAITGAHIVCVSESGFSVERNGVHYLLTLPPGFAPLDYHDVLAWMRAGAESMQSLHTALLDELPPAQLTDWDSENSAWTTEEQAAILKAWWIGLFLEPATQGRPILSLIGQKGSGKSVTARLIGLLYYGKDYELAGGVGGSRAVKDLVASISHTPVTIADDQNDVPRDIIDTLCRVSTGSRVQLAAMHETLKLSTFQARASIAMTSNRPAWALRDDLMDRMLPLFFASAKTASNMTEIDRNYRATTYRNAVWGETLYAIYFALASNSIWDRSTRFEAWETMVRRVADHGGWHTNLHSALSRVASQRVAVACWADPFVYALYKVAKDSPSIKLYSAAELYDAVTMRFGGTVTALEEQRPSTRALSNPVALGKFLAQISVQGSTVVDTIRGPDINGKATWALVPKV